jgi:hypothetical protein
MVTEITLLRTHWDAGEAHVVIEFLDELRDLLWSRYGDEIMAMQQEEVDQRLDENDVQDDGQIKFDDKIEF